MGDINQARNSSEFDADYLEWEERDESISYFNHCVGMLFA